MPQTNIFEMLREPYRLPKRPKLFEAFAGVGCQHMAFNRLGIEVDMVGISEIDKYAIQSYNAIHGETKNFGSICDIHGKDLPEIDVFTYSFPCTDLSKAGKQKGLNDTRSGLVYEVLRILHELKGDIPHRHQPSERTHIYHTGNATDDYQQGDISRLPKVLIMENVVDLIQVKFIKQFQEIQLELEQLGYSNYTETMNAKDYGVAQNRDRVFMVSILGDYYYEFPKPFKLEKRLKDYLETKVDEKYYLSERAISGLNRADESEHTPTWLNEESSESPCIDTRVGALTHWSPYVKENERYIQWDNTGKGHNSQAWRAYHTDGNICTISASNANGDKTQIIEPQIIVKENNSKGYDVAIEGDCININQPNSKTRRGRVGHQIAQTLTTQQEFVVVEKHNAKEELCEKMLATGELKEGDMIRHSYTKHRMAFENARTENSDNVSSCLTTRPDTLGVVVSSMIDDDGNVRRYLDSPIVDQFNVGDCADISFPNGYNKGKRVYDGYAPALNLTTTKDNFVVKQPDLRIRKLTPRECWRLMGIDDQDFDKASQVCSNSQLYKQAGNGIVVDVFAAIIKNMTEEQK